jgi:hypothetical protein
MSLFPILVLAAASIAAVTGLVLGRGKNDPLTARLVAPVLGVAAIAAAISGAVGPAVVLCAATAVVARRALSAG